jgi:predicted AAA+ superfamily ATPase
MNYIHQNIEQEIEKYLKLPQIIAIVGPRRSGKTTLLKYYSSKLKNSFYLSFEEQKALDLFQRNIELFIEIYVKKYDHIFLDEFQYAKMGGKKLKYIFDFYPNKKIFVSGSSAAELTIQSIKHLVGRVIVLPLYSFSFDEFLRSQDTALYEFYSEIRDKINKRKKLSIDEFIIEKINKKLDELLLYGSYPEIILAQENETKKTLLSNIYNIFFLREVRDMLSLSDDYRLKTLLTVLSLQLGNISLYQELATISNLTIPTVKKYLNFFERTFISFPVYPFFTNKRVELVKNPKPYFFDLGFRNCVISNFSSFQNRTDVGAMRENFVAIELMKKYKLNFWRTKSGAEVDFIIDKESELIPIEIKSQLRQAKVSQSLASFITKYKPKQAYVLSLNTIEKRKVNSTTVHFLPLWGLSHNCNFF